MKAKDIMTSPVVSVTPVTSVREIAALLLEHRISAVPVLDDGRLVGIVSEGDLLHRHEIGTDRVPPPRSWWLRLFSTGGTPAEYVRSHAAHARDIMAREVVSVAEDTPVADIARCSRRAASSAYRSCATRRSSASSAGRISSRRWRWHAARSVESGSRATRPSGRGYSRNWRASRGGREPAPT